MCGSISRERLVSVDAKSSYAAMGRNPAIRRGDPLTYVVRTHRPRSAVRTGGIVAQSAMMCHRGLIPIFCASFRTGRILRLLFDPRREAGREP